MGPTLMPSSGWTRMVAGSRGCHWIPSHLCQPRHWRIGMRHCPCLAQRIDLPPPPLAMSEPPNSAVPEPSTPSATRRLAANVSALELPCQCATDRANAAILASWAPCGYGGFSRVLTPPEPRVSLPSVDSTTSLLGMTGPRLDPTTLSRCPVPAWRASEAIGDCGVLAVCTSCPCEK